MLTIHTGEKILNKSIFSPSYIPNEIFRDKNIHKSRGEKK